MLVVKAVNNTFCTRCGLCILDCPQNLFQNEKPGNAVVFSDPYHQCIACGHCLAVCPVDAVRFHAEEEPLDHPLIATPEAILGREDLYIFLRARRSIRHYKSQRVPEDALQRMLSAMRHAPTASNRELIHFTVITSREMIARFSGKVIGLFKIIYFLMCVIRVFVPFGRKNSRGALSDGVFLSVKSILRQAKEGKDPVFFSTPCLIVLSSPNYGHQAGVDAGIALTHGMLAAQAEGLGTCLVGFAQEMLLRNGRFKKELGMPARHLPQGVMALGYPKIKYKRAPMRKPISVTRL